MMIRLTALVLAAVTAVFVVAPAAGDASLEAASPASVARVSGADRYATATEISAAFFTPGVPVVYVASGQGFADALAGAAAAGSAQAPVLLVRGASVPEVVHAELARLRPGRIVVLGGPGAVSDDVVGQLGRYAPASRLAGDDRYATSAAVSRASFQPGVPVAFIASGHDFPDALAGAAVAGAQSAPVLLVPETGVTSDVAAELRRLSPQRVVVLGGEGAVTDTTAAEAARHAGAPVTRHSGADRYATAAAVAEAAFPEGADTVFLASGRDFPDALAGAPIAGMTPAPVLLVTGSAIPDAVHQELARLAPREVVVLGGEGSISRAVADAATTDPILEGLKGARRPVTSDSGGTSNEMAEIGASYIEPPSNTIGLSAIAWARTQLGQPYRWGGTGEEGYDCSGLVMRAFEHAGVQIPRVTRDQWAATTRVALADLEPGDLVFWSSNGQSSGIYHVAIYTGDGRRIHAPYGGKTVEEVPMWEVNLLPFGGRVRT